MGNAQAGMGVAIGDVFNRGMLDIFVTHLTEEKHTLWQQGQRGHFQDRTGQAGVHQLGRSTGWGAVLADFNNDGWLDLAWVNGRVKRSVTNANPALGPHLGLYAEKNQLAMNMG